MNLPETSQATVPSHLVHMIWLGERPEWLNVAHARWVEAAESVGLSVVFWDERSLRQFASYGRVIDLAKEKGLSVRATVDILRILIVYLHGGIYVDCDTVPLRPEHLIRDDAWIGAKPEGENLTLINAHYGFPAGHPFLSRLWVLAWANVGRGVRNDHFIAGPRAWRRAYEDALFDSRKNTPTLVPTFPTIESGSLPRLFAIGETLDLDTLREEYADASLLHVIYSRKHAR